MKVHSKGEKPACLSWNIVFFGENRFALPIIVFEKIDVEIRIRIRPHFKFYAAVAVYSPRASLLTLIPLFFMFISYILSSTFQFK